MRCAGCLWTSIPGLSLQIIHLSDNFPNANTWLLSQIEDISSVFSVNAKKEGTNLLKVSIIHWYNSVMFCHHEI